MLQVGVWKDSSSSLTAEHETVDTVYIIPNTHTAIHTVWFGWTEEPFFPELSEHKTDVGVADEKEGEEEKLPDRRFLSVPSGGAHKRYPVWPWDILRRAVLCVGWPFFAFFLCCLAIEDVLRHIGQPRDSSWKLTIFTKDIKFRVILNILKKT